MRGEPLLESKYKSELELLKSKIESLFQGKKDWEGIASIFTFSSKLERNLDYVQTILGLQSQEKTSLTPKQKSLIFLFTYLSLAEGIFSEIVEIIAFLLMQNDHDLYDPRNMEFVKKYKQLEKIDLFVKMQFIEKHGFGFLCNSMDRPLRNSIAHLDLKVTDDGSIINTKTEEKITDFNEKMVRLISVSAFAITEIAKSAKGETTPPQSK